MNSKSMYSPGYVIALFDEMSATYGVVNLIASFGFSERWRRQCVRQLTITEDAVVCDLMSGMGEAWPSMLPHLGTNGNILALDFSPVMCAKAKDTPAYKASTNIEIREEDVLQNSMQDNSADLLISSFGLKTFSEEQIGQLAGEIERILKPGGSFSLIEISVPDNPLLRWVYGFYLQYCIPIIGKLLLGNPENYRMLWRYTEAFGNCKQAAAMFESAGLEVQYREYFFGCASGLYGSKHT